MKITNSETFSRVDGLDVILDSQGGYKQVDVFCKKGILYAKNGVSFLTLKNNAQTSKNSIQWRDFVLTDAFEYSYTINKMGFLELGGENK